MVVLAFDSLVIREARDEDLDGIERLERTMFDGDRLSRRSLRYFLNARSTDTVVAAVGDVVAGYAMIGFRRRSGIGWLFSLAVGREHARRGIGRRLLTACEATALRRGRMRVQLEVRTDNAAAIALYETSGYRRFGIIEDFYEDGASAIRCEKVLATPA